jgi:LmbE family N-acetylglucosaminyl deacetylase
MLSLKFDKQANKDINLLLLGAHCDDIEIGCGGTLLKIFSEYKIGHVKWVILSSNPEREQEARNCAEFFLKDISSKEIIIKDFKDGFLPQSSSDIKKFYEEIKGACNPEIIFTHYREDFHQDHRLLSELTWNTFRNHFILEYEIPKYDSDLGTPTFFVELDEAIVERKIDALQEFYVSQRNKHWFEKETFRSIMRIRGMQSACKFAEAFHSRKIKL